jgi:apolipoprotein N-acyltransferase
MLGLLSGLLALASLPPVEFGALGFVWLVPWFVALRFPLEKRWLNTALAAGLPASHVVLGLVEVYPAIAVFSLGLAIAPMMAGAAIGLPPGGGWGVRCGLIIVTVVLGMSGLRCLGLPVSAAAISGLPGPSELRESLAGLLAAGGVITLDVALVGAQAATAAALCRCRGHAGRQARGWRWMSAAGLLLAILAAMATRNGEAVAPTAKRVAVIQTALAPYQKTRLIADTQLETVVARHQRLRQRALQADPDWIVWPEASTPGLDSQPRPMAPAGSLSGRPFEIRHGYRYRSPGQLSSTAVVRSGQKKTAAQIDKRRPLPFAEAAIADPRQPSATTMLGATAVSVLVCSDIFHTPSLHAVARSTAAAVINPTSIGYLGGRWLPLLHQRAVQIQAAALGRPVIVPTNGSAAFWASATGALHRLGAGPRATTHIATIPIRPETPNPSALLGVGIWAAFLSLPAATAGTIGCRVRSGGWRRVHGATVTGGVLAVWVIQLAIAHQANPAEVDNPDTGTTRLAYQGITSPERPHSAIVAAFARSFAIPVTASDVPADRGRAWRWLCRQTRMGLAPSSVPTIRPPALGVDRKNGRLRAIRWGRDGPPVAFDPIAGVFEILHRPPPDTRWLRAIPPHRPCHESTER